MLQILVTDTRLLSQSQMIKQSILQKRLIDLVVRFDIADLGMYASWNFRKTIYVGCGLFDFGYDELRRCCYYQRCVVKRYGNYSPYGKLSTNLSG